MSHGGCSIRGSRHGSAGRRNALDEVKEMYLDDAQYCDFPMGIKTTAPRRERGQSSAIGKACVERKKQAALRILITAREGKPS